MNLVGIRLIAAVALVFGASASASAANPAKSQAVTTWNDGTPADEPVQLIVSVPEQQVNVYAGGKLVANSPVSTGRKGYPTPTGVFSILQKRRHHHSNIYSRAPMPFMQRLTWSGIALHASDQVPDVPASHGCVRLPHDFAEKLFRFTELGAHVIISGADTTPVEISHPKLFQPIPKHVSTSADIAIDGSESRGIGATPIVVASADPLTTREIDVKAERTKAEVRRLSPVRLLVTRRTGRELVRDVQTLLKELGYNPGELDGWMGKNTGRAIVRFQESRGLQKTGAMSEELVRQLYRAAGKGEPPTGHLYVRSDFAPVFDVPITIAEPETPLGSHLITAMDFDEHASEVRWLAVTLNDGVPNALTPVSDGQNSAEPQSPTTAKEVLDRIEIPMAVRRWISAMLTPGSSLAVSDDGISRETLDKGTDFVVLTR